MARPLNFRSGFPTKVLLLAATLLLLPAAALAQGGSIRGNVLLPNGAFLNERARVTLLVDRGVKSNVYTDEQGRFQFVGLTPALYEILVEPDGNRFEKARAKIEVFPGSPAIINISLVPKKSSESKSSTKVISAGELDSSIPSKAKKEFQRASELAASGQSDEAITHLRKAIEIYPHYLMAHNDLGAQLLAQQKLEEAADEFRRAIEIDPKAFNPRLNLGIVLVQQKRYGAALASLHDALALQSDSPAGILYDGLARQGLKDFAGAERQLLLAHNLGGVQFAKALFHLGQIYADRGDLPKAREALEEYLREEPNGPESADARKLLTILR
jgi:tetratricopeptide (TPR) repeat protein